MDRAVTSPGFALELDRFAPDRFLGVSPRDGRKRVFGGQVIGQALVAACHTVEGRQPHSLHGYFLLGGDPAVPIIYEVDRIRDGRSFATRRVLAIQHGRAIFALTASFHEDEGDAFEHGAPMPVVAGPDEVELAETERLLESMPPVLRDYFACERPIELRPVSRRKTGSEPAPPTRFAVWLRAKTTLPHDPTLHRCVLAYASDLTLLDATLAPHERSSLEDSIQAASLDHAVWFHRPFRADEWLLYAQDSPSASGGRGFARGLVFDRAGRLVASVAQEGLIRRTGAG